jgi:6-phosphogluconolactonase
MRIQVVESADEAARRAAEWLRAEIGRATAQRGHCLLALSGGRTPWRMLHELRRMRVHWNDLHVFQVDERVVPANDERRNSRRISELLVAPDALAADGFHAMPVERPELAAGAEDYARLLAEYGGQPPVLDVAQLGLGADGHTASLLPRDPLLADEGRDVGISAAYQGTRRMTLMRRALNAARHRMWLVTGAEKARALQLLWNGDESIPAALIARESAFVYADVEAAAALPAAIRSPH